MSAADIIAEALDAMPADARPVTLINRDRAAKALAALKAAGYRVVKLPDVQPDWHGGMSMWPVEQTWQGQSDLPGAVSIRKSDGRIGVTSVSLPADCAANARNLAAALLAAADAAEAAS